MSFDQILDLTAGVFHFIIMQIIPVPPGNMSNGSSNGRSNGSRPYKIGNRSALQDLDHKVGIDHTYHTDHLSGARVGIGGRARKRK